jgi:CRISPR-associated protein Cmr5
MVDLEMIRANYAYSKIGAAASKELGDLAQKLPIMLKTNGLLATWAFIMSKREKNKAYKEMQKIIWEYFQNPALPLELRYLLLEDIFNIGLSDSIKIRRLTDETIALSSWLKRAAETLCSNEAKEVNGE